MGQQKQGLDGYRIAYIIVMFITLGLSITAIYGDWWSINGQSKNFKVVLYSKPGSNLLGLTVAV